MRIAYLINYDLDENSGVIQKILQQSSKWIEEGHKVFFISLKTMCVYDETKNIIYKKKPFNVKFGRFGTAINLFFNHFYADELCKKVEFDILYMRYVLYMPFFNKILKKYKSIMEINSDDTLEYKLKSNITHFYNLFTRNYILKHIDGFVSVSEELKQKFKYLNKPIEVIANGIEIKDYNIVDKNNTKPIFVFIGSPNQSWHGIDKIKKMAEYFKEYEFCIIGINGRSYDNIKYFGYLSQEESTKIINKCDIGIGTLSLYKKGLTEASPLKTRQYLACGLPLIYAYKDTDIEDVVDFALKLENTENNIDYDKIEKFVYKVHNNKRISLLAREFAENTLDYSIKEKKRLIFLQKVFSEK